MGSTPTLGFPLCWFGLRLNSRLRPLLFGIALSPLLKVRQLPTIAYKIDRRHLPTNSPLSRPLPCSLALNLTRMLRSQRLDCVRRNAPRRRLLLPDREE